MKALMMDNESTSGGGRLEDEGTFNGGMTTEQMAGMEPLPDPNDTDDAGSTLGGTADSGAGPVGDGEPADTDQ